MSRHPSSRCGWHPPSLGVYRGWPFRDPCWWFGWLVTAVLGAAEPDRGGARLPHGFAYTRDQVPEGPWSIHRVQIDRKDLRLELQTSMGQGDRFGLTTLSEQMRAFPAGVGKPIAALNGDFYYSELPYVGDPKGLQIVRGELVSGPCAWSCLWVDATREIHMTNVVSKFEVEWPGGVRTPFGLNEERTRDAVVLYTRAIGTSTGTRGGLEWILEPAGSGPWLPLRTAATFEARVREVRPNGNAPIETNAMVLSVGAVASPRFASVGPGATIRISTQTIPTLAGVPTAIGGGPALVRDGKNITRNIWNFRHPRAAVGWNKDYVWMVEVDGRQLNLSVGMTLSEFADYLIRLGCTDALNMDGGGSAACWVYGHIMNNPSEGQERGMANALVLVQREKP